MAVKKQPKHEVRRCQRNTELVIDGEVYKVDDPILISFGFLDIMPPLLGYDASTRIIKGAQAITQWYRAGALFIGYFGLIVSVYYLLKAFYYLLTNHNSGKVPSLTKV